MDEQAGKSGCDEVRILAPHRRCAALLALACSIAFGCTSDPEPGYLRIRGPAPPIASPPATPALLVVFWASWCEPCRQETPQLVDFAADLPDDLSILLVSHDDDLQAAQKYFGQSAQRRMRLRLDPGKKAADAFGVSVLPASFLVVDGQLAARFDGPEQWNSTAMRRLLQRLMRSGAEAR